MTTNLYGVNAAAISGSFGLFGQVRRTYVDNGIDTGVAQVYDALDRLVRAEVDGTLGYTQVYTYDAIGNLIWKTGVGSYSYPASGASSVRPHAVTATSNGGTGTTRTGTW